MPKEPKPPSYRHVLSLIFGILHFIIISITVILQSPLSKTSLFVLYKVLPPTVFLMSILFNQIAIRFFNHLMSHRSMFLL